MLALITGGTSGIGKEFAFQLAEMGYNLIITGRREKEINAVAESIKKLYRIEVNVKIVSFPEGVDEFLEYIKTFNIDLLVNNVGYGNSKSYLEGDINESLKMVDVHISSLLKITHNVINNMKIKGIRGSVINVSSLASYTPTNFNTIYGGTKSFINFFTESLYNPLKKQGIKIQLLLPGFTYSDFHSRYSGGEGAKVKNFFIRWHRSQDVVKTSLSDLEKNKLYSIHGKMNKFIFSIFRLIPRGILIKSLSK